MEFVGTAWGLLPPIIAIALALITKEVYLSLFIGVLSGSLLYSNFSIMATVEMVFQVLSEKLGDSYNIGILIFLVFLGILVALMNKAGGSAAYGDYASKHIKTKRGAMLSTFALGVLIFVDDYFNCLTVGSVMRPVTDRYKVSRAKLAYIIDSTAAPICIIAPISSWAAAVSGYTSGDGFVLFLQTIPYNLYAWLTLLMVVAVCVFKIDFGKMKKHELAADNGNLLLESEEFADTDSAPVKGKGGVIDLVLPVLVLIGSCVMGMLYTGGFFSGEGVGFTEAFANCDAPSSLVLGSFFTIVVTLFLYLPRGVLGYREFTECFPAGFKLMVSPILILALAWTLGGVCRDYLEVDTYVGAIIENSSFIANFLPAILFLVALGLAFSTGTSWGTFGILIPIITGVFPESAPLLVISISAILAGSVCGDHISPISDTTIMASAGAQCNHIVHVSTQIPYALLVSVACIVGYIVAGFTQNVILTLLAGLVIMGLLLGYLINKSKKETKAS